jgi:hypothetical protein
MRALTVAAVLLCLAVVPPALASGGGGEGGAEKEVIPDVGVQRRVLQPSKMVDLPIQGFEVTVTQVSYPGVPERSACRLLARASNRTQQKMGFFVMVKTFNSQRQPLNNWLIPTADIEPGQSVERIYSCKMARYMYLDLSNAQAWPALCMVDGEERSPCPAVLNFVSNMEMLAEDPSMHSKDGDEKNKATKH